MLVSNPGARTQSHTPSDIRHSDVSDSSASENAAAQELDDGLRSRAVNDPSGLERDLAFALGSKANPTQIREVVADIASGKLSFADSIAFVDDGALGAGHHGAFSVENGGTIYLERGLLDDPQALEGVFLEEAGHGIDAAIGGPDAAGDEGALFALAATGGTLDARMIQTLLSENDSGTIMVDGRSVAVEFNGEYTSWGSGSETSSPPTSNPYEFSGQGSSPASGAAPEPVESPVAEPDEEDPSESVTRSVYSNDLLERNTASGGTTQAARTDFAYNFDSGSFEVQNESNQSGPGANTWQINGGTSDEHRYNNSESQAPDVSTNVNIGETLWQDDASWGVGAEASAGDDDLGARAEITAGAEVNGSLTAGFDGDTAEIRLAGDVFVGVEAEAGVHAGAGPVDVHATATGRVGVGAEGSAGLTLDPRNGVSANASAGAFAGAELELETGASLGDTAEVTGGVDLKVGIGAEAAADVDVGWDAVGVDLELGVTLGIGADFNIDLEFSPSGMLDDAGDVVSGIGGWFSGD